MDRRKAPTVSHLIWDRIELLRHRLLPAAYQEPTTKDDVWWGTVNLPLSENSFKINRYLAFKHDVSNSNEFFVHIFFGRIVFQSTQVLLWFVATLVSS